MDYLNSMFFFILFNSISSNRSLSFWGDRGRTRQTYEHFNCMEHLSLLFFFKNCRHLKFTKNVTNIRIADMFVEILMYNHKMRILLLTSAAAPENTCELFHSS